jgi:hypothetical protein
MHDAASGKMGSLRPLVAKFKNGRFGPLAELCKGRYLRSADNVYEIAALANGRFVRTADLYQVQTDVCVGQSLGQNSSVFALGRNRPFCTGLLGRTRL